MGNFLPAVLKLFDLVPAKGYRNAIFFVLSAAVVLLHSYTKVMPDEYYKIVLPGLLGLTGYFAGVHE